MKPSRARWTAAAILYIALIVPPVRHALESSMTAQMLLQLPLLAAAGYLLGLAAPAHAGRWLARWNHNGIAGLVLASLAGAYWMLPRLLDASASEPGLAAAKLLTVPLLVGLPLAWSWPRASFVVRGVFTLELLASLFRLGWLYTISPQRLCSNYLLDDQQRLGQAMIVLGATLFLWIAWKLLAGDLSGHGHEPRSEPGLDGT